MLLLIRLSRCTYGVHLSKRTQPRMFCLDHRLTASAAFRRKRPPTALKSTPSFPLRSPCVSVLLCRPPRGLSVPCSHSPTGPARTHTPVAFASSSAASAPTPADSVKPQTPQPPTDVPLEDVRRILHLAHPERWRLAGVCTIKPMCRLGFGC